MMQGCILLAPTASGRPCLVGRAQVAQQGVVPRLARDLALTTRHNALIVCSAEPRKRPSRASKASKVGEDGQGLRPSAPPPPYAEALLQREYELWQRQAEMYERLEEQYDRDLARFAEERTAWQQQEAVLRQETAELRAQLLYVLAQLNSLQANSGGGAQLGMGGSAYSGSSGVGNTQQGVIAGREAAAALPSSSGGSGSSVGSPAEQVKAVVDALKAGSSSSGGSNSFSSSQQESHAPPPAPLTTTTTTSSGSGSFTSSVSPSAAWPASSEEAALPAYAADLMAAVAAVDTTDVLSGVSMFAMQDRRSAAHNGGSAGAAAAAEAPAAAAPAAAAPAAQQQAIREQPPAPAVASLQPQPALAAAAPAAPAAGDSRGPPPPLTLGADDIFWVSQLHIALVDLGYYPGDEDIDDFYFGEGTQSALMTMQCCSDLPETGICDDATWLKLLGPSLQLRAPRDLTADMMANVPGITDKLAGGGAASEAAAASGGVNGNGGGGAAEAKPYTELFTAAFSETVSSGGSGGVQDVQQLTMTDTVTGGGKVVSDTVSVAQQLRVGADSAQVQLSSSVQETEEVVYTAWPILHEGDGGREVHLLHVALEQRGYYPTEDDLRWWIFGDGTMAALKTCQACNGYPESGVCDAGTWRVLLGADAEPSDLSQLHSGDSADEDIGSQSAERVWLMGEQRWEDRSRVKHT